jgi:Tfp pilus assembly protein PilW
MLRASVRRWQRMRSDRGMTLAELMVTMGLTTILGTMAVMFFVVANRTGNGTILTNQNTGDARVTLDEWTSMLRVAGWLDTSTKVDRFEEVTATKIVFYANLNNRSTSSTFSAPGPTTKIALLLRVSKASTGQGQLVEVRFGSDNTTVASTRQLGVLAGPTNGAPIFQPYSRSGSPVDLTQLGCKSGTVVKAGLCLQSVQSGAGMQDPTIGSSGLTVTAGPLRGNPDPTKNVDKVLQSIGSVGIAFTVSDSSNTSQTSYTSLASVSSGYPS